MAGRSTITATLGSVSNSTGLTVGPATLQSITVNPQNPLLGTGTTAQFTATGHYSDASTQPLTTLAAWTSSDATIASVDSAGVVSARIAGTATITATLGSVSGSSSVTVAKHTLQSIVVTPVNPSINVGQTQQFTATGTFADGTTQDLTASAHWSSSSASVATINNGVSGGGLATGKGAGTTTITATFDGISGSTTLTVN